MEGVKNVVSKSCLKLYFLKKTNVDYQGRKDLARKDDHDYWLYFYHAIANAF